MHKDTEISRDSETSKEAEGFRDGLARIYTGVTMDISSIYNNATASASSSKLESLQNRDFSKASDDELMDACKQFESYFVEMVMKEVTKNIDLSGGATGGNATLMDYYKDKTISSLAEQTTETGNLGLAQQMYEQMKRQNSSVTMSEILAHQAELREENKGGDTSETEGLDGIVSQD